MRLDRLDLVRYGRFTEVRVEFPAPAPGSPDLHLVYGPNEAGKSTLFSAWLDLLYGIPLRTRYDFLHPGPTMQIGARLTHAGGVLEAVRLKRTGPSLQDATGQPLPEAVMQAVLAGLGRDGYGAMFSLDDDTLEQGGDSILASRGDLGEMLFSASAGLAGLGPQLEAVRKEIDAFHKPRARNTTLKAAKDRLHEIDRQRREMDTTASAVQKLHRDVSAAEKAWEAARQAETRADAALRAAVAAQTVLPQQARLARMRSDLALLSGLPDATEADARDLQALDQGLRELAGQMATRADALDELVRRQGAVPRDPAILPLADRIAQAAGLYPLHQAALADLPRRRDTLAATLADLARVMQRLGLAGPAADHAIAPAMLARLRALVAQRDRAMQALALAQDEAQGAVERLNAAQAQPGDLPLVQDLNPLQHLVARLRQTDPDATLTRAQQDLALRDADLARALVLLAPWRGSAEALGALDVPAPWQLAAWDTAEQTTRRALQAATDARDRCLAALAQARSALPADAATTPTLADAAEARRQREAAWAAHVASLTPATAARFEAALRLDDRISLHLAEAMAATRHAAQLHLTLTRLKAEAEAADAECQAATTARQSHEQAVVACTRRLGLAGATLPDLRSWLDLRDKALTARAARDAAQAAVDRADSARDEAARTLAAALALPPDAGFARLWSEALARLDAADRLAAAARRQAEREADVTARAQRLEAARRDLESWRRDWHVARTGAALSAAPDDDPGLATLLDDLDHLTRLEAERADLADRIAKMDSNSRAFQSAAADVLAALGLPDDFGWTGIPERLSAARQAERDHAGLVADLAGATAAQQADQARAERLAARRRALADRLGWAGDCTLQDHLSNCLQASRLRHGIAQLEAELPPTPVIEHDPAQLASEVARLSDRVALARADSEARFAALTEAQRALRAVGGDDAVARLAAERANLLHMLEDQARAHLAQRFALVAFEQGLRRYRDHHRSAMLLRASAAFRQLSNGAYAGLAAQPDGAAEVLVALAAQGGAKLATDLSKGTRFQLYLALRIAGYHELAKSRPPVPFIADDIMETFDDARAEQAFALLGDMSRTGQVIYLTHHRHLCDIALSACPEARIVDLQAVAGLS